MNIPKYLKQYQELPYIEKRILQLRALSKDNLSKTDFLKIINQSDLKISLGKQYTNDNLTAIFYSLTNKNLLTQNYCNPIIIHYILMDAVNGEYSDNNINSILNAASNNNALLVNRLRLGIYLNNLKFFQEATIDQHEGILINLSNYFASINIEEHWLNQLLPEIQYWVVAAKIYWLLHSRIIDAQQNILIIKQVINHKLASWSIESEFIIDLFLDFFLLDGDIDKIAQLSKFIQINSIKYFSILGVSDFLQGNTTNALINFDIALKTIKNISSKRNICLSGTYGVCHILSLLQENNANCLGQVQALLKNYQTLEVLYYKEKERSRYNYNKELPEIAKYFSSYHQTSYGLLAILTKFLEIGSAGVDQEIARVLEHADRKICSALDDFILFLLLYWTKSKVMDLTKHSSALYEVYNNILLGLISVIKKDIHAKSADGDQLQLYAPYKFSFTEIIQIKPEWDRALNTLSNYFNKHESHRYHDKRLVWMLYTNRTAEMIVPIEQKRVSNANWNKGRPVSLKRLYEHQHNLDYLSLYDRSVINCIERNYGYYSSFYINNDKALLALANHPLIFDGNTGEHVELVKTTPELIITEDKNNYQIKLSSYSEIPTVKLQENGINKYQVLDISESTLEITKIIGHNGINVPKVAKEKVLSLMQNAAASISVRTELDSEGLDSKLGDPSLIIQLIMIDDVLKLKALVRPFGGKGSYYKPSKGNINIVAQIDNIYQSVTRNFTQEQDNIIKLLDQCSALSQQDANDYEWRIDDLETSLEILYQLNNYKANNPVTIEWPHGQSLFVDKEISFDRLKLNITSNNQWFSFDGEVSIDETQIIEMQDLLVKLSQSKGRFIELSDKKFIALTESFAKRLQELNIATKPDGSQTIHKLAAPLLLEFAEKSKNVTTDSNWQAHINNISLTEKYNPEIPNNLQAELRPYQIEGFKWLSRLSHLGFGACLADDMGLGKTVQTIALLLEQAIIGPCLVIAPASVCYVWEEECRKFAPSLNCISLHNSNNREELITNLKKMDILICSYGILYQIEELLITKQFQIVVLDEAQAIKNFNTKRFKIITQLKTTNRIALSGTPIENRTEELWNLFEFLNPGFLGSRQSFQAKYTKPIELDKNIITRNTLKRLIQPFLLRRIKSKVLDELPAKIEQTIFIEPTEQEKSFYEALRRESLERINNLSTASSAQKRFSILAEITKLRRACCASTLVDDKLELPNSKLEAFDEIISELKANNHRALVFSQYVGYLDIVRKRLDGQKISYQYLDGSSTQKHRQESVEAFQSGIGELFLISLKAGGVGLNLTSADYVIHLDPWWNPAIEDQASDRAHRIGQTRPVTIYRLVMKHSIEEKILKMHHEKRGLAISLLSDSDKSASLNENDLLKLISQKM